MENSITKIFNKKFVKRFKFFFLTFIFILKLNLPRTDNSFSGRFLRVTQKNLQKIYILHKLLFPNK